MGRSWRTGPGKTDRYCVVRTTLRNLLPAGNPLLCCHSGPRDDFLFLLLSGGKYFDVSSTYVDTRKCWLGPKSIDCSGSAARRRPSDRRRAVIWRGVAAPMGVLDD